jgi:hypothetical protein
MSLVALIAPTTLTADLSHGSDEAARPYPRYTSTKQTIAIISATAPTPTIAIRGHSIALMPIIALTSTQEKKPRLGDRGLRDRTDGVDVPFGGKYQIYLTQLAL